MTRRNVSAQPTLFSKANSETQVSDRFDWKSPAVILSGDSAETLTTVHSESVKLIITSPPYNLGKVYEKATALDRYLAELNPILNELIREVLPHDIYWNCCA